MWSGLDWSFPTELISAHLQGFWPFIWPLVLILLAVEMAHGFVTRLVFLFLQVIMMLIGRR